MQTNALEKKRNEFFFKHIVLLGTSTSCPLSVCLTVCFSLSSSWTNKKKATLKDSVKKSPKNNNNKKILCLKLKEVHKHSVQSFTYNEKRFKKKCLKSI